MNKVTEEVARALGYTDLKYTSVGLVGKLPHYRCWIIVGDYPEMSTYSYRWNLTLDQLNRIKR